MSDEERPVETPSSRTRAEEESERSQVGVLRAVAELMETRDPGAQAGFDEIGELTGAVARELGLEESRAEMIAAATPLHDIGMVVVPDRIVLKGGALEEQEWRTLRTHTTAGAEILDRSELPVVRVAREIALTHHERWDGSGYPEGRAGEEIPISGRIAAVCDAYTALTSKRPYRPARSREEAREEIRRGAGSHFDPEVVEALMRVLGRRSAGESGA